MEKIIYQCDINGEPARLIQSSDGSAEIIYKGESLQKLNANALSQICDAFNLDEVVHFIVNNKIFLDEQEKAFADAVAKMGADW